MNGARKGRSVTPARRMRPDLGDQPLVLDGVKDFRGTLRYDHEWPPRIMVEPGTTLMLNGVDYDMDEETFWCMVFGELDCTDVAVVQYPLQHLVAVRHRVGHVTVHVTSGGARHRPWDGLWG